MTEAEFKHWLGWKPDKEAIDFMVGLINCPKKGWEIPRNGTVYRFDRARKAFVLVKGQIDGLFYMNKKVLEAIGWTIEVDPSCVLETGFGKN